MTSQPEVDPAVAAGLAEAPEQPAEERQVDASREKPDDEGGDAPQAEGAVVHHLPVRLEQSPDESLGGLVPVADELRGIASLAVTLAMAQVVPKALRDKPADVLAVLLTGRELGVAPMTAIRTFHVIDGSVTVAPKMRAAMVRERGLGKLWPHQPPQVSPCPALGPDHDGDDCLLCAGTNAVTKLCRCGRDDEANDGDQATWHGERTDQPGVVFSSTYTRAMAGGVTFDKWAGPSGNRTIVGTTTLLDKDNWKNYPDRMLSWRALGYLLDDAFPEVGTGIYSPDEIGAVTDEEGQPILDVESTETLVPRSAQAAKNDQRRASQEAAQNTPANPGDVQRFRDRIAKLNEWEGAADKLKELWTAKDEQGNQKVPPLTNPAFAYRHQVLASAMIDAVERMCAKGEFPRKGEAQPEAKPEAAEKPEGDPEQEAGEPEPGAAEGQAEEPERAAEEEPPAEPGIDFSGLPEGHTHGDDLQWAERAPEAMVDECIAHVKSLDSEEVNSRLQAAKIQRRGSDTDRRERLTTHMIRARLERQAKR